MIKNSILAKYIEVAGQVHSAELTQQAASAFESMCHQLHAKLQECDDCKVEKIQSTLDFFYFQQIFSLPNVSSGAQYYNLLQGLITHTAAPPVLAVILSDLFSSAGITSTPMISKDHVLLKIKVEEQQYVFIDVASGRSLDLPEVDSILQVKGKKSAVQGSKALKRNEDEFANDYIVLLMLSIYKTALIENADYEKALRAVDMLIQQEPDNPYERRDRGFLLQQLNCEWCAVEDLKFFVEQCPTDPLAQLIQLQLENIPNNIQPIH
ncbi:tetratricopeptide repeat protein [Catenovulum sediminis]|uniref:Tetratricopeptide repeat protein n=1 Tax=Catenovulum sediminis TaxID=1740262 RepID=A0ABV1RKQ7_9ALTE|nr:tetratricopeptide repeat protein [Catenovulum sediminis]